MNLPTRLKIGGKTFKIKVEDLTKKWEIDDEFGETMDTFHGMTLQCSQQILLHTALTKEGKMKVLLHEILETIDNDYELALPHPTISTLETALYQIIKDNKLRF